MDIASIITFNIVLLAAILSPGPAFLYIMTTSVSRGRVAGFAAGLGLGIMAAIWTLLAILGLEVLISLYQASICPSASLVRSICSGLPLACGVILHCQMTTIIMVMVRQCRERGCAPLPARISDQTDESKIGCVRNLGDCHDFST